MNKKNLLLTLIFFSSVVASWWLLDRHYSTPLSNATAMVKTPDGFMTNAKYVRFNKSGQIASELYSPKIIHYSEQDLAELQKPKLIMRSANMYTWTITGEQGTSINKATEVKIRDNVKVVRLEEQTKQLATLTTTEMTAFPDKEFAITNQPVTIIQPGSIINGVGLTADLKSGDIKLLSQARGVYNVQSKP